MAAMQGCQLSWIIRKNPDFELFRPVSILESEISWIIAEVCQISCRFDFLTMKFQIFCVVLAIVLLAIVI